MKNIQVIGAALNAVYDIFPATDDEFSLIFLEGEDIAFIDDVYARGEDALWGVAFTNIWRRRIAKRDASGIHGLLFYELTEKKRTTRPGATKKLSTRMVRGCGEPY